VVVNDPLDKIRKLAALKADGIIDAAEFDRLKNELLAKASSDEPPRLAPIGTQLPSEPSIAQQTISQKITPEQIARLNSKLHNCESSYQTARSAYAADVKHLKKLRIAHKYFTIIRKCHNTVEHIALGPIGPVIIIPAVGILIGSILSGAIFTSDRATFRIGIVTGAIALAISINLFVIPSKQYVQSRIADLAKKMTDTEAHRSDFEPLLAKYKAERDNAKREYNALLAGFQSNKNLLLSMDWRTLRGVPFELFLRDVFLQLGYQVNTTKAVGDQGVDLIAEKAGSKFAIQAKGYAESVGNAAIQEAHTGMSYYGCNHCVVVTNSTFTTAAQQLAQKIGCQLIDGSQMESLILGKVDLS
jgi:HJR/Mrr/RecB family endonuclease